MVTNATSDELLAGDQLAGYEIEAIVGRGGMGVVYRAFDARLGRPLALKLIAPERAQDHRFRERFLVETQLAASLDHSNVVPVYDAGEADGRLYIAMRYVEGTDLCTLLAREAPLDPERALALVGQVAAALDAAHARGLVHRDVKPANILVTEENGREHCYLSDFGLTRGPDPGVNSKEPPHLSGTVAYTSPEQITGEPVTGRADLYSLACVLYETLTGNPPFAGRRSMAVLVAHIEEPPPPLPSHGALEPVLAKALAKAPAERYATCGELVGEARTALGERELPPELDFRTPLIGREGDLLWLHEAWREAMERHGHVVVVSGPRGIGKTRLAAELARVVRSQGGEVRYVSCIGVGIAAEALAEVGAATTPVLLVLDDLDAADEELLDAVRHAGVSVSRTPALVLATSRTAFPGASHRELQPLDGAAVAELATAIAGDAALALPLDTVLEETEGVPLAVQEVVAEWLRAEARLRLGEAALRAAAGRQELRAAQADLTSSVVDLQRALGRVQAGSAAGERVCPFKGLASFDVADADSFYGREQLVAELVARLPGATLLGVVGPSGSGKSSIVRAGLSAALGTGALPGSEDWVQVVIRPGDHPLDELARARRGREGSRLLLVVDQLEEVFTLCRDEGERLLFLDAVSRPAPHETVVIAVRADFYGRFAALPRLASLLAENHVLVGPMKAEDLRRAIELPSRRAGLRVEPALVDALVTDVVDEPGGLPLLSTALVELWQHRDDRTLRLDAYRESGGVRGAVARIAEEAYEGFTPAQQETARRVLLRLASVEGDDAVRRRASLAELELDTDEDARHVVAVLTDSRLVTVGEVALEVAHEALLREWPRLREWLEEDAEGRRLHGHVIRAAKEWEDADREPAELYRGARLAAALDWTAEHDSELNELERSFLAESQGAGEAEDRRIRRTNRRLRLLLAGAVVFLAAAVAGGGFAVFQSLEAQRESDRAARAARIALAGEVAAAVLDNYQGDPDGSILAAVEAVEITRRADGFVVPEAAEALTIALGATVNDDLTYEAGVANGRYAPTATSDQLLELARARVPRPMTDEECRFYLHLEACPPRSRELPRAVVPFVTGETEEVARARLERAGFGMRVTGTWPTGDPDKDRVVLEQSAGIADAQGRVWSRPGLSVGVTLYRYTATRSADFGPQSGG